MLNFRKKIRKNTSKFFKQEKSPRKGPKFFTISEEKIKISVKKMKINVNKIKSYKKLENWKYKKKKTRKKVRPAHFKDIFSIIFFLTHLSNELDKWKQFAMVDTHLSKFLENYTKILWIKSLF